MVEPRNLQSLHAADVNSAEPPVSEAELTALALRDPPPDDFQGSGTKRENPLSERSTARGVWLVGTLAVGLVGILSVYFPKTQTYEIARQRSPDGTGDAILMEFSADTAESRSYKVCLQRPSGIKFVPNNSREVAYLGGVSTGSATSPVRLIWTTSSQLQIRYVNALSVHIYQPVFSWGPTRYAALVRNIRPIRISAVQAGYADEKVLGQP
jgi:hypothetical protein